jgi:hypothetical protein
MEAGRILGVLLVAIGVISLIGVTTGVGGEIVVGAIGIAFLVGFAATRNYGLLVPGGIMTGLGAGIVVDALGGPDAAPVLGLGMGFLLIALVDVLDGGGTGAWWWPLIPGGILTVVGATQVAGIDDIGRYVVPAGLVVVGAVLLLRHPSVKT